MKQLILVRDAQSQQQVRQLTGGWTDCPLTDLGQLQARQTALRLARMLRGVDIRLYTSDLARAAQTARIIADELALEPILRPELREWNNGRAAGLTLAQAKAIELPLTQPVADWRAYPEAETWREMTERIWRAMDNIAREVEQTAVLVAHENCGLAIIRWWLGLVQGWEQRLGFELSPGSITQLSTDRNGQRILQKLNDTCHLDSLTSSEAQPARGPRELGRRMLAAGRFIQLHEITWIDRDDRLRSWELAQRPADQHAVMIIAWLVPSQRLLLVRQFRPPARGPVIEFPAGLIDPGETPEQAARRELQEETGYHGRVIEVGNPAFNSPGLTSEAAYPVLMEIDEDHPANVRPQPSPEEGEDIEILLVKRDQIADFVNQQQSAGLLFDGKVATYLAGLLA